MKELSSAAAAAAALSSAYYTLKAALVISEIRTQWFLDVHSGLTFSVSDVPLCDAAVC